MTWARGFVEQHPAGHCSLLTALEGAVYPPELVIVRGPLADIEPWLAAARAGYHPSRAVYGIPYDCTMVPNYLPRLVSADTRARVSAFFCSGLKCSTPITDFEEFKRAVG